MYHQRFFSDGSPRPATSPHLSRLNSSSTSHRTSTSLGMARMIPLDTSLHLDVDTPKSQSIPSSPRSFCPTSARNLERYPSTPLSTSPSNKTKVLVTVNLPRSVIHHLRTSCPGAEIICINHTLASSDREKELNRLAVGSNIIIGLAHSCPYPVLLNALPTLQLFQSPYAGVDDLIQLLSPFPEIPLANNHGNCAAVAEHAIAMLYALHFRLLHYHSAMLRGEWLEVSSPGVDEQGPSPHNVPLSRSKVGVLGYGFIGRRVVDLLKALGSEVSICKKTSRVGPHCNEQVYTIDRLDEFLTEVDSIVVCLPLTNDTRHLIGRRHCRLLSGGCIVNVSRGEVFQEEPLFEALQSGLLSGFASDVFWKENDPQSLDPNDDDAKFPFSFPFHTLSNVLMSPHRADSPAMDVSYFKDVVSNINAVKEDCEFINFIDRSKGY
ncbi:hypothetical protein GEMRC1_005283 [Eukaryota sp. GEM-RC1]